jgi:hypothetical protein
MCACGKGKAEMTVLTPSGKKFNVCRACAQWWYKVNPMIMVWLND